MSQNRGFTQGLVAIKRFLILMIYSKKPGPNNCVVIRRLSPVRTVAIGRFHCSYLSNESVLSIYNYDAGSESGPQAVPLMKNKTCGWCQFLFK